MNEGDRLRSLLDEWEAPAPPAALEARVRAAYRAWRRPTMWQRLRSFRVSMAAPALAAALLIVAGLWLEWRAVPPEVPAPAAVAAAGYMTRIETAGFQPLRDGEIRVIRGGARP